MSGKHANSCTSWKKTKQKVSWMNNWGKVRQQVFPGIETHFSEVTLNFKCFSYVSELFTALSKWFSCDFMCLPRKNFPRHGWPEKRRVRPRGVQIKRGQERFPAREEKHFGEVCLWTQLKIIIVKKHKLTVQGLSRLKALSPLLRRGKSFSCCCFFCVCVCAQQMSPTDDIRALARRLALDQCWALSGRAWKNKEMFEHPCDTVFNYFSQPLRSRKMGAKKILIWADVATIWVIRRFYSSRRSCKIPPRCWLLYRSQSPLADRTLAELKTQNTCEIVYFSRIVLDTVGSSHHDEVSSNIWIVWVISYKTKLSGHGSPCIPPCHIWDI